MAKCKICPRKRVCRGECYGDNPCDFALTFDRLGKKLDRKTVCVESLNAEKTQLRRELDAAVADLPKWIPVTERLPEKSDEYLVYCGEYDGVCVLNYEILETKSKWRSRWKEVTHWMPLPEPPKEE